MATPAAHMTMDGTRLGLTGALTVSCVAALWPELLRARYTELNLAGLERIDSAGLALLARLQDNHPDAAVTGMPVHLDALRQAYRLDPQLRFSV